MRIIGIIIFFILFLSHFTRSQDREWVPKSFDSLDVEDEKFLENVEDIIISYGFFPNSMHSTVNIGVIYSGGSNYSIAKNIQPAGLKNMSNPYSGGLSFNEDDRIMREKFSDEEDKDYPNSNNHRLGLAFIFPTNIRLPLLFKSSLLVNWQEGLLFNEITNKYFLGADGNLKSFREIGTIYNCNINLSASVGLMIPIYGVSVGDVLKSNDFYYLSFDFAYDRIVSSKTTQYLQILDQKEMIRYDNGLDTLMLDNEVKMNNLVRDIYNIEIGIGQYSSFDSFGIQFELKGRFGLNSIIEGQSWKYYSFEIGTAFYFGRAFF